MDRSYRAPGGEAQAELREKGSRFHSTIQLVADESDALEAIAVANKQFSDATHVCWAWRVGMPPRERSADAGEPAGTAGEPILRVLRGAELSDVLALVVRWYGGTKLGKGGLARAYAAATRLAMEQLEIIEKRSMVRLTLTLAYEQVGNVKRYLHGPDIEIIEQSYDHNQVEITFELAESRRDELKEILANSGVDPIRLAPDQDEG